MEWLGALRPAVTSMSFQTPRQTSELQPNHCCPFSESMFFPVTPNLKSLTYR